MSEPRPSPQSLELAILLARLCENEEDADTVLLLARAIVRWGSRQGLIGEAVPGDGVVKAFRVNHLKAREVSPCRFVAYAPNVGLFVADTALEPERVVLTFKGKNAFRKRSFDVGKDWPRWLSRELTTLRNRFLRDSSGQAG